MEVDQRTGKADVIYMIATHVIFLKSWYISEEIGYIFCIYMLLTQLFISRFWYSDDYYDHYDDYSYDFDYSGNEYYFVYIFIVIMFNTSHVFRNGIVISVQWYLILRGIISIMWNIVVVWTGRNVTCGSVYQNKKTLQWHRTKQHGNDVCCLTFFVENLHYMNFSHILWRCAVEIFHNLHSNVLYYRQWEMRVMTVQ